MPQQPCPESGTGSLFAPFSVDHGESTFRGQRQRAGPNVASNSVDNGNGKLMCIRCRQAEAPQPLDYCAACSLHARDEVSTGLRMLEQYLAAWAAFDTWLGGREDDSLGWSPAI